MKATSTQPAWVSALLDTDLSPMERILLAILARYQGQNGHAYPSRARLAADLGTAERTVERLVKSLEKKRRLTIERPERQGRGMHNRYIVHAHPKGRQDCPPSTPDKGDTDVPLPDNKKGDTARTKRATTHAMSRGCTRKSKSVKESMSEHASRLSQLLFDLIRQRKPDCKPPNLREWAVVVDCMIRLDSRKPERIEAVIRWCQADTTPRGPNGFCWANNILSTAKLREKFDRLELEMDASAGRSGQTPEAAMPVYRDSSGRTPRELALAGLGGGAR